MEGAKCSWMWHCVVLSVVPTILRITDHAFILKINELQPFKPLEPLTAQHSATLQYTWILILHVVTKMPQTK